MSDIKCTHPLNSNNLVYLIAKLRIQKRSLNANLLASWLSNIYIHKYSLSGRMQSRRSASREHNLFLIVAWNFASNNTTNPFKRIAGKWILISIVHPLIWICVHQTYVCTHTDCTLFRLRPDNSDIVCASSSDLWHPHLGSAVRRCWNRKTILWKT